MKVKPHQSLWLWRCHLLLRRSSILDLLAAGIEDGFVRDRDFGVKTGASRWSHMEQPRPQLSVVRPLIRGGDLVDADSRPV